MYEWFFEVELNCAKILTAVKLMSARNVFISSNIQLDIYFTFTERFKFIKNIETLSKILRIIYPNELYHYQRILLRHPST